MTRTSAVRMLLTAAVLIAAPGCRQAERETLAASVREIRVPQSNGSPVMTDGIIQPGEWDDVTTVAIGSKTSLFLKRYQGHLFVGVDARQLVSPSIDLFFAHDSAAILQLHRSAQLGERALTAGAPDSTDPEWVWGRTSGWYSSEVRWTYRLQDSLMRVEGMSWPEAFAVAGFPSEIGEFDILVSKLGASRLQFRIDVTSQGAGDSLVTFPAGTSPKDPTGWATLILN